MKLEEFYNQCGFPDKLRIPLEKNILLIVPDRDFDISPVLARLSLSKSEVAVTCPKEGMNLTAEVVAAQPKMVLQVGGAVSKKFPVLPEDGSRDDEFKEQAASVCSDSYVNLHHHDEFSIKDGLGTVVQLNKILKAQRRSYCCVTNHGSIGGWIKQYNACRKSGIRAIFGMESYVSDYRGDDMEQKKAHRSANHLVLLARTMEGFNNIIQIHNDAQLNGFYYTPRANHDAFRKWGKGIIASSACMAGELPSLLLADKHQEAEKLYEFYKSCFDEFYVEIQIIEFEKQREANKRLIEFARKVGAPLLLTCDSHYLEAEHSETHDILMCIRQHKTLFDEKGEENEDLWNFDVKNLFARSGSQMRRVFENGFVDRNGQVFPSFKDNVFTEEVFQEAMSNTLKIARSTEEIELDSTIKLPKLYANSGDILRDKAAKGFVNRMLEGVYNCDVYKERLAHELDVIIETGWADYFLVMDKIVSDTVKDHGEWSCGYGRGSAAGSLVSYCLGLTDVDPIEYNLLFERFISPNRSSPPDIDMDFDPRIRDWVKQHIVETFGQDHVCSIGTYQTYKTKAVILDVARALNEDLGEANNVTKKIDSLDSFATEDGDEAKVDKLSFDELCQHYPDLRVYFDNHPMVRHHAEILRNQVKNMGKHAGGVIISDLSLSGKIPMLRDKDGSVISAWAEAGGNEELSSVGLVKFDILGLASLSVVSDCLKLIEHNRGIEIKRWEIPIDDKDTIRKSSKKDLHGIFQLDNPATKPVADKVKMESLMDVAAVTSLIRPGPRDMKMDLEYAERKHGKPYEMPDIIRDMLKETHGVVVFQEQCQKIAQKLAGFSPPKSYKFLKAIAKKQQALMESFKVDFISGSQSHVDAGELTLQDVEGIWDLLAAFAEYAFNACLSLDTVVETPDGMRLLGEIRIGDRVLTPDGDFAAVVDVIESGKQDGWEITTEGGKTITCTLKHKFLCEDGMVRPLREIIEQDMAIVCEHGVYSKVAERYHVGFMQMRDITIDSPRHLFMANGMATSNSHAVAYSALSTAEMWLKLNYPTEYMCALIDNSSLGKKKHGKDEFIGHINYARHNGIEVLPPDINMSVSNFAIVGGKILFSIKHIKMVATMSEVIEKFQPFTDMKDFYDRVKVESVGATGRKTCRRPNKRVVENLIAAGSFDGMFQGSDTGEKRNNAIAEYYAARGKKKEFPPRYTNDEWLSKEVEVTGLCLSQPPLYKEHEQTIKDKKLKLLCELGDNKRAMVFGQLVSITPRTSKTGNPMFIAEITDGLDMLSFYVFKGAMQFFRDNFKLGMIAGIPIAKFDDGDARFYDERRQYEVIQK